jgi:hypothetical protein
MSAPAGPARVGLLGTVLARVEDFLLEPALPGGEDAPVVALGRRTVVTVFGLARACGATMLARALGAELAARDDAGAAAVGSRLPSGGIPLASPAAVRLGRALADVPGARTRPTGRLCLVDGTDPAALADGARELAPVVLDAGGEPVGGVHAALADSVVLVATPSVEPALAEVAIACLGRLGSEPVVALNRCRSEARWDGTAAVELPEARMGAQLALGGREPRGELGRATEVLADLVCEGRS